MTTLSKKKRKQKKSPELKIARVILFVLIAWAMVVYFSSCKPREITITKIEYKDRVQKDTLNVTQYDSIFVREKGDTVEIYKYKFKDRYRVKIERDTVWQTDTINYITPPIETKVPVEVQVYGLFWWLGLLFCIAIAGYLAFKLVTKTPFISIIKKLLNIN